MMGFASLYPSYRLPQQPLPRHVIEFEPDAVGVFEQDRVISRRPLILARRADDVCTERLEEAVQFIDVGALSRAEAQMMQADAPLLECRAFVLTGFSPRNGSSLE
jgi:hypothetical protein